MSVQYSSSSARLAGEIRKRTIWRCVSKSGSTPEPFVCFSLLMGLSATIAEVVRESFVGVAVEVLRRCSSIYTAYKYTPFCNGISVSAVLRYVIPHVCLRLIALKQ